MKMFHIRYRDPHTGEDVEVIKEYEDTTTVSAQEWAEDAAYMLADKGPYTVTEISHDQDPTRCRTGRV